MLGRLENLDEGGALVVDILGKLFEDLGRLDGVGGGLNVVGADGFDDFDVASGAGNLSFTRGADQPERSARSSVTLRGRLW